MHNTVLVGTFLSSKKVAPYIVRNIVEFFHTNKVFIFNINNSDIEKFLLTFNVGNTQKDKSLQEYKKEFKNTIQLHRNKENNVLFTINSLNKVIEEQGGNFDSKFKVDWGSYKNSCILLGGDGMLKVLRIKLYNIIEIPKLGEK